MNFRLFFFHPRVLLPKAWLHFSISILCACILYLPGAAFDVVILCQESAMYIGFLVVTLDGVHCCVGAGGGHDTLTALGDPSLELSGQLNTCIFIV